MSRTGEGDVQGDGAGERLEMLGVGASVAQMSFAEFSEMIAQGGRPPEALSSAMKALWYDAVEDWDAAHEAAQKDSGREGAWVHAYLHRKEGDLGNAGYWYARAARPMPETNVLLDDEWEQIAKALLKTKAS